MSFKIFQYLIYQFIRLPIFRMMSLRALIILALAATGYTVYGFSLACYGQYNFVGLVVNRTTIGNQSFVGNNVVRSARWRQTNEAVCFKLCNGTTQLASNCANTFDWLPLYNATANKIMVHNSTSNPLC